MVEIKLTNKVSYILKNVIMVVLLYNFLRKTLKDNIAILITISFNIPALVNI